MLIFFLMISNVHCIFLFLCNVEGLNVFLDLM